MSEPTPTECSPFYTKKGHTTRHTCAHDDVVGDVITLQLIIMTKNLAILSPTDLLKIREKICITTREGTRLVRQTSPASRATPHIKRRRFNLRSLLNFTLQTPHSYICPAWDSHMSIVSVGLYNYFLTNFTEISKSSRVLLIVITKTAFCRKYFRHICYRKTAHCAVVQLLHFSVPEWGKILTILKFACNVKIYNFISGHFYLLH